MREISYAFTDDLGRETGEAIRIGLAPDGSADLSGLPDVIRQHYLDFGVPDPSHQTTVFPAAGEAFLSALLQTNGPYVHVREAV